MTIVALKLEDGTYRFVDPNAPMVSLISQIKRLPVETVIFGEKTDDDKLIWEKNFTGGEPYNIDKLRMKKICEK